MLKQVVILARLCRCYATIAKVTIVLAASILEPLGDLVLVQCVNSQQSELNADELVVKSLYVCFYTST